MNMTARVPLSDAARLHLESAARAIRIASQAMDAAVRADSRAGRMLDGIEGADMVHVALAEQIEALAQEPAHV